jgi:hypothetical protein
VIETLLIDGPQPVVDMPDIPDTADWLAPVIPLDPGRARRDDAAAGRGGAGVTRSLPSRGDPRAQAPSKRTS